MRVQGILVIKNIYFLGMRTVSAIVDVGTPQNIYVADYILVLHIGSDKIAIKPNVG